MYTEDDKQKYKNLLLATNAHRCDHDAHLPVLGNKEYKYKNVIASLMHFNKRDGSMIIRHMLPEYRQNVMPMAVINNAVDYVL